jgi:glyoxylase-like metal-dependent hydrolase (beta-lactamase superfamily II)
MRLSEAGRATLVAVLLALPLTARAQQNLDTVQVTAQKLSDRLYVLFGSGGNIGLSVGDDGAFIVDDQFAPLSEKIKAAVARVSTKPIRFVVNTHWHGDHTGGNEKMGQAGAVIVAHENVRKRMSVDQLLRRGGNASTTKASPYAALPVITFAEDITLHLNGDSVHVMHVPPAHTDGDALIYYEKANAIHMGDTFFAGRYPFIDTATGGTNATTQVIPGHGPVSTRKDLQQYRDVLTTIRGRILALVLAGKSLEQVTAARPTAEYDTPWGTGFINAGTFIETVYADLKARGVKR